MGKKDKNKKKGLGAEKTSMKTEKKLAAKQKKLLAKIGEADIAEFISKLETEETLIEKITEVVCPPPSPRSSFTLVSHPEKEELILFGGEFFNGQRNFVYNDLFFYNIQKKEWKQLRSPSGPTPRCGHQMVSLAADGGQLWLFGGEHASPSQMQFYHYKDLWVLSLRTKQWKKIIALNGPSPRSGHRMVTSKRCLFVFGGFYDINHKYQYYNDIHIFSIDSYTWLKTEIGSMHIPSPRSACCMAACPDDKILIWGGYSKAQVKKDSDRGITHTDMFALVPSKNEPGKVFKWIPVKASGYKPLPLSSVGCTTGPNGKVYCFGGVMDVKEDEEDVESQFSNDLVALDLTTHTWRQLEIIQKKKDKKITADPKMEVETSSAPTVVTDGVFTVTVAGPSSSVSARCSSSDSAIVKPTPRMNAGLCVCKGHLYLYGGIYEEDSKQRTFNDFYALDLHKLDDWKVLIPNNLQAHEWLSSESDDSKDESDSNSDDDDDTSDETDSEMEID